MSDRLLSVSLRNVCSNLSWFVKLDEELKLNITFPSSTSASFPSVWAFSFSAANSFSNLSSNESSSPCYPVISQSKMTYYLERKEQSFARKVLSSKQQEITMHRWVNSKTAWMVTLHNCDHFIVLLKKPVVQLFLWNYVCW